MLVTLGATAEGEALELAQRSKDSVAKKAEPLITLELRDNKLEAEAGVASTDVAHLRAGDKMRLKLGAIPFQ